MSELSFVSGGLRLFHRNSNNMFPQTLKHFFVYREVCEDVHPESLRRKISEF